MNHPQEWYDLRRSGITGSDIGAIINVSKFKSPMSVYIDKLQLTDIEEPMNDAMHFGNLLEDIVAEEYSRRSGNKVMIEPETLRHPDYPLMLGNIDRWIGNKDAVLECKTTGFFNKDDWGPEGTDIVPATYLTQVAWYVAICDVPYAELAALAGGNQFRIYRYERNKEFEEKLIEIAHQFWENHILAQVPPDDGTIYDIAKLYPRDNGKKMVADGADLDKLIELRELKGYKKELDQRIKDLQADIQAQMKDFSYIVDQHDNVLASWRLSNPRSRFDSNALKEDHPDLYEKYLQDIRATRTFLIK